MHDTISLISYIIIPEVYRHIYVYCLKLLNLRYFVKSCHDSPMPVMQMAKEKGDFKREGANLPQSLNDHIQAQRKHECVVQYCHHPHVKWFVVLHEPLAQIHPQHICVNILLSADKYWLSHKQQQMSLYFCSVMVAF